MKNYLQYFLVNLFIAVSLLTLQAKPVEAACRDTYGGQVCEGGIDVDKQMAWSGVGFQDNIAESAHTFSPNEEVRIKLTAKNIGDVTFDKVIVRDFLPSYLVWVSGGNYISDRRVVEFEVLNLETGKTTQDLTIVAKVVPSANLASGLTCTPNNFGEAVGIKSDKVIASDKDEAAMCVRNGGTATGGGTTVLGITTQPSTGPDASTLLLLEVLGFAAIGGAYLYVAKSLKK